MSASSTDTTPKYSLADIESYRAIGKASEKCSFNETGTRARIYVSNGNMRIEIDNEGDPQYLIVKDGQGYMWSKGGKSGIRGSYKFETFLPRADSARKAFTCESWVEDVSVFSPPSSPPMIAIGSTGVGTDGRAVYVSVVMSAEQAAEADRKPAVNAVSIHLIAPDGSASYPAGSGRSFMIAWYFSVTPPAGSTICTTLVSQTTGKSFAFPADKGCIDAATVPSARTGTLVRTSGYDLGPDTYKVKIQVISSPSGDGKGGGVVAEDTSSATITLTSPTTVSLISNTMSAQAAGVASSIIGALTDFLAGKYW